MYRRSMFLFWSAVAIVVAAFLITDSWFYRGALLVFALATAWRSLGYYERAYVGAARRALSGEASRDDDRILGDFGRAALALVDAEAARDPAATSSTPKVKQGRSLAAAPSA